MEASLFVFLVVASQSNSIDASREAARAFSHVSKLDVTAETYYNRHTSEQLRNNLTNCAIATRIVVERTIIARWEF